MDGLVFGFCGVLGGLFFCFCCVGVCGVFSRLGFRGAGCGGGCFWVGCGGVLGGVLGCARGGHFSRCAHRF